MKKFTLLCSSLITLSAIAQELPAPSRSILIEEINTTMSAARPTLVDGHDYGWEYWGEGQIFDGWLTTIWRDDNGERVNPYEYIITCEFQRSTTPEGYVRIVEPWRSATGWFGQNHDVKEGCDLIIDLTDPRLVIIMPQMTGITATHPITQTKIEYVVHNYEGYALYYKDDVDGTVELNEKFPDQATTMQDGVIHIITPMWTMVNENEEIQDDDLGPANAPEATIYLPGCQGVSDITAEDESEARPEYYDLSGRRIDVPTAPGLYIRRCGSKATKVVL